MGRSVGTAQSAASTVFQSVMAGRVAPLRCRTPVNYVRVSTPTLQRPRQVRQFPLLRSPARRSPNRMMRDGPVQPVIIAALRPAEVGPLVTRRFSHGYGGQR